MADKEPIVNENIDNSGEDTTKVKARSQGWSDKEHWKGNPDDWVDAETFVKRGEEWINTLKKSNDTLTKDLGATKQELKQLRATTEEFKKFQKEAYERKVSELESQLTEVKKERAQAISDGDGNKVNELDDVLEKTRDSIKEAKGAAVEAGKAPAPVVATPDLNPDLQEWLEANPWFGKDRRMTSLANGLGESLRLEFPNLTGKAFLDKMNEALEEEFPTRFGKKTRTGPSVESGSGNRGGGRRTTNEHTYDNLPSEAQKACDRYVKSKLMTQEDYLKEYDWS